jgi:tetratricopeptide (TPR) repeat protein
MDDTMDCRYLKREEERLFCELKNSQITKKYTRRVCIQNEDSATCIKAVEALQEADRLAETNNISCLTFYAQASSYFAEVKDFLKAILSRIKLIMFQKKHEYYDQAIEEAKEVKELYRNALKSMPSLKSSDIADKIASLEQSLQVSYNQSKNSGGLVRPSAVLQTISEMQVEAAVGHVKHYSIEHDLTKEIETVIEKEVTGDVTPEPLSEPQETSPEIEVSSTTAETGDAIEKVPPVETVTTAEMVTTTETVTTEVNGVIESVDTIEEADSSMGFLPHYTEKAENYEKLSRKQLSEGSFDKAAKYTALSSISWILAGNPQEGLMTLNRLLKDSKGKRQAVKQEPIFIIARSLILASFNKDMGKFYEAELLIRQLKVDYSTEEMELIGQGLKTVQELIE